MDLIDRQQAIDAIRADSVRLEQEGVLAITLNTSKQWAVDLIGNLPSAQQDRKKGKWEQVEVSYMADMDTDIKESMAMASMFCPVCKRYHNEVYLYGNPTYGVNFCSNCGTDMRGDQA